MGEQEPRVAPIIRLPQIRAGHSAASGPEAAAPPAPEPDAQAWAEDEPEDDEQPRPPFGAQISGDQTRLSGDTGTLRAGVSSLLRRALLNFAEQERQRARLVSLLALVQAAILLGALPGDLFGQFRLSGLLVALGGLGIFGVVWLLNWGGRVTEASFLLVGGGGALVALDLLLSAAQLLSLETLLIALLFLLVILSGGLLFSPETAVILAALAALFTSIVLLVFHPSSALAAAFTAQGRYLAVVFVALVLLGVGVVAWFFGRQMQESVHVTTFVAGLQMSNKGLRTRLREAEAKARELETGIALIQQTHARVAAGDYGARVHVEGDLLPLAVSLNLMLERVESFVHGEYERERMETAVVGLAELAGRVGQESLGQIPVPTGTALDGLSIAIKQMQTNVNQRLTRVQQSAVALMATVGRCQDQLLPVAEVLEEHLHSIDALVLAADNLMNSAQRQSAFASEAGQLLLAAAPEGVDLRVVDEDARRVGGSSALRLAEELERKLEAEEPAPEPVAAPPAEEAAEAAAAAPAAEVSEAETPASAAGLSEASALAASEPSAPRADDPVPDPAGDAAGGPREWLTLADLDREVAEEALAQEPGWNLEHLRELAGLLARMAGEATQQERNARTLTFKLRSTLQGMPKTRRVDMIAGWLRAALDAMAQAAGQVQLASKPLPASAFHPASPERAPASHKD